MTNEAKNTENELFQQEVSKEELNSVSGGDCGKSSVLGGGSCPRAGIEIMRCYGNDKNKIPEEMPKPPLPEDMVPFKEVTKEELEELIKQKQ